MLNFFCYSVWKGSIRHLWTSSDTVWYGSSWSCSGDPQDQGSPDHFFFSNSSFYKLETKRLSKLFKVIFMFKIATPILSGHFLCSMAVWNTYYLVILTYYVYGISFPSRIWAVQRQTPLCACECTASILNGAEHEVVTRYVFAE